jgi:MFS transporter, DHA2 family, multidrug resistance protein
VTIETGDVLAERYGPTYRWLATFTAMTGALAMVLSSGVMNVAVPSVMGAFGVGLDMAQLVTTAYLATMTATMLLSAWLIEVFGQRWVFGAMLVIFLGASALGGIAPNIETMILARILQGGAAGVVQPLAMATVYSVFPPERRGTAMGIYSVGLVLAPTLGPIAGGWAVDGLGWRWVFFLPMPACVLALMLGPILMPTKALPPRLPSFDWLGFALVALSIAALLDALSNGQRRGWESDAILLRFLVSAAACAGFVTWQLRAPRPLLDLALFRNPRFAAAAFVAFVFGAGLFASNYVVPVFVQTVQGWSAMRAGWLLGIGGLAMMVMFPFTGRLLDRVPGHQLMWAGLALLGIGFLLMNRADVDIGFWTLAWLTVLGRIGLALVIPAVNGAGLQHVPAEKLARGSGAVNFFRQLGGGMGVIAFVVFLEQRTQFHAEAMMATQTAANPVSLAHVAGIDALLRREGLDETARQALALDHLGSAVWAQAYTAGFQDSFLAIAAVAFLTMLPVALLRERRRRAG